MFLNACVNDTGAFISFLHFLSVLFYHPRKVKSLCVTDAPLLRAAVDPSTPSCRNQMTGS